MNTNEITSTVSQPRKVTLDGSGDSHSYDLVKVIGTFVALIPGLFIFTSVSLDSLDPAYNWVKNTVSELIWGPHGWLLTLVFCVFGIALITLALRLRVNFAVDIKSKTSLALMALIGIGFLIIAMFPTKAPGAPQSVSGLIHIYTVRVIVALFPASCLLLNAGIRRCPEMDIIRIQNLVAGVLGIILIVPGAVATLTDASWLGAIERIILLNGLMWIEVITISVTYPGIICRLNRRFGNGLAARANAQRIMESLAVDTN